MPVATFFFVFFLADLTRREGGAPDGLVGVWGVLDMSLVFGLGAFGDAD